MIIVPQISSLASDCLAAVETCMSDLCKREQAFYGGTCEGKSTFTHFPYTVTITGGWNTEVDFKVHFLMKVNSIELHFMENG